MQKITITGKLYGKEVKLIRVSKAKAKKLYEANNTIMLCPSKLYPLGMIYQGLDVKKENRSEYEGTSFEYVCEDFKWYNCDCEMGYYIHFYEVIYI